MGQAATIDITAFSLILGVHRLRGYAGGDPVNISYSADAFTLFEGLDGINAFVKNSSRAAVITAELMPSSISNDVLSGFHLADLNTPGGLVLPIMAKETNGTTVHAATSARVQKFPDSAHGGTGTRTWAILVANAKGFVGGIGTTPQAS